MIKKLGIITVLVIATVLLFCTRVNAESNSPKFYLGEAVKYENSDTVNVELYLENANPKMMAWSLDLEYDSSKVEFVSSKAGKDLSAIMKLAEDIPEESRVAIGAFSMTGFEKNGLYYTIIFKIKDSSKDIPLNLKFKEAADSSDNDIICEAVGTTIKISKEQGKAEEKTNIDALPTFEATNINEFQSVEELILQNSDLEFSASDVLNYVSSDEKVIMVSSDGTLIPNEDGKATVNVKLNGEKVGELEIEVEDGVIKNVKSLDKKDFTGIADNIEKQASGTLEYNDSNGNSGIPSSGGVSVKSNNTAIYIIIAVIVIVLIIISFIKLRKKNKKGRRTK